MQANQQHISKKHRQVKNVANTEASTRCQTINTTTPHYKMVAQQNTKQKDSYVSKYNRGIGIQKEILEKMRIEWGR